MATYRAPLRDMAFVMHECLAVERQFAALPGYEEANRELIDAVLMEAAKLGEELLLPLNRVGDTQGCRLENGVVRTPPGFKEAYRTLIEGGWTSLACDTEHGGQGLPKTINFFVDEIIGSANLSFSLYNILTFGAYLAIHHSASAEIKARYLPRLAAGEWSGTMCLTEPHCGTDLGLIRTKAVAARDGTYRVSGTKIFITGGEHDLAENIVHLVLARRPDAPSGVKGISLFVVPKLIANEDGTLGGRNGVFCRSIEEKMGIHGVPTCVLDFEDATAYLVGEADRGLKAMFTMMNHERLVVGLQGLSQGEVAYQSAVAYARERLQGRAPGTPQLPDEMADPIIVHPDVRRMLLTARAYNEGARALAGWLGLKLDIAERHPDAAQRERAGDLVSLLTPLVKAFFTDCGTEVCGLCLQVFGGHGYIAESGMEQLVRDARITPIYEGTNGVQALDLVARKLPSHGGRLKKRYFAEMQSFIDEHAEEESLSEFVEPLRDGLAVLIRVTDALCERALDSPSELGAAASDYLRLMGLVSLAFMWAMMANVASSKQSSGDVFYARKLATGRYFVHRLLPQIKSLEAVIGAGARTLMELEAEGF